MGDPSDPQRHATAQVGNVFFSFGYGMIGIVIIDHRTILSKIHGLWQFVVTDSKATKNHT